MGVARPFRELMRLRYFFEDYCLDTKRRELRQQGTPVRLEPQVFDVLEYLIRERDRMVRKDDLIASVWDGRIVSESALATRINAARTAIGNSGKQQRLIRTVPSKGIRFVGVAREEGEQGHTVGAEGAAERRTPSLPEKPSIVVLPFANLSCDPDQDYFTDGIVEDIITGLSRIGWLFVIARNSSFAYKSRAVDVKQVGRELGVRYILKGSVRKAANRVRIAAQLIDASTGAHVTAERFDGTLQNIFDLQDEITTGVIGAISPWLETAEIARAKRKPTESLDAYDQYLRGMAAVYQWTKESHDEALRLFCDSILGPIEASEGHYGGELMRSLEAFIEENGQWERAARRLYCHRHTLRYRIRRVEELTGRNLGNARDRIEFGMRERGPSQCAGNQRECDELSGDRLGRRHRALGAQLERYGLVGREDELTTLGRLFEQANRVRATAQLRRDDRGELDDVVRAAEHGVHRGEDQPRMGCESNRGDPADRAQLN